MNGRLYRSTDDRVIAGVCGGLADRLDLDPALVRIGYVVLALATGVAPLVILYVVMAAVVPEEPGWRGVRPVGPAPWETGWDPGGPAAGAVPGVGSDPTAFAGSAPSASPTPPGAPPAPDAVPGWVPPGGGGPTWGAPGWDPYHQETRRAGERAARRAERHARRAAGRDDPTLAILAGVFLVGLGAFFMLRTALDLSWELLWPAALVMLGVLVVIAGLRPRPRDGR